MRKAHCDLHSVRKLSVLLIAFSRTVASVTHVMGLEQIRAWFVFLRSLQRTLSGVTMSLPIGRFWENWTAGG